MLVSCGATPGEYNLLTVAWTGTVCTDPPMCYVSVRPERHSYGIIRRTGEFVINLTTRGLARAADWCGVRSGRDYDKFREMGLTPGKALKVAAPIVEESPVSIECRVRQVLEPGYARHVSGRGGRRAGRCRLYRPCHGPFLPRTGLPDRLLPRRIFRAGRSARPFRLVGAEKAAAENVEIRGRNKARGRNEISDRKETRGRNKTRGQNEISDRNEACIRCRICGLDFLRIRNAFGIRLVCRGIVFGFLVVLCIPFVLRIRLVFLRILLRIVSRPQLRPQPKPQLKPQSETQPGSQAGAKVGT